MSACNTPNEHNRVFVDGTIDLQVNLASIRCTGKPGRRDRSGEVVATSYVTQMTNLVADVIARVHVRMLLSFKWHSSRTCSRSISRRILGEFGQRVAREWRYSALAIRSLFTVASL